MRPSQLSTAIETVAVNANRPVLVSGPPGVCKSAVIKQLAAKLNRPLIDVRAVLLDPVDLRGLPKLNGDGRAHWCPPAFLPHKADDNSILFLDELPQAAPLVQSACLQLVLDRRLGEYVVPAGVTIIAAGNRQEDRAGAHRLITPLLNRLVHIDVDVNNDDWRAWAVAAGIHHWVPAFMMHRPKLLFQFDPKSAERAFPTPRSWEFVSDCLRANPPADLMFEIVAGCVGKGAAAEFMAYVKLASQLPNPLDVLKDPDGASVSGEPSVNYALIGSLVEQLRKDAKLASPFIRYIMRMPKEFGALAVRDGLAVAGEGILSTAEGKQYVRENSALIVGTGA